MRHPGASLVTVTALAASLGACASAGAPRPASPAVSPSAVAPARRAPTPETVGRGCPPERARDGEVRIAFLGDSGYGTGVSEWGTHGQEAIAARINHLDLPPDLVFFLGDNIYWLGNAELYKSRFDDMYDPLIRECRAHVALGNHDVKGCRAVTEYEQWEGCLQELRTAVSADLKARYLRQGMSEEEATARAHSEAEEDMAARVESQAVSSVRADCLPGDATAYENEGRGSTCHASDALAHAQFGFGSVDKGDPPKSERQRYYSILYPLPKTTRAGAAQTPEEPEERPLVDVMVLDTNTLQVQGSVLGKSEKPREDRLQLLWLRGAMSQWVPSPGDDRRVWKILAMHHPPRTPRGCACFAFGKCLGGHQDELALDSQLKEAFEGLNPPDLVMAAHNHIYARSHPMDLDGKTVSQGPGAVRYFVSGGGGAPLYGIPDGDTRWARTESFYHFVYMRLTSSSAFFWTIDENGNVHDSGCFEKGSSVDLPLSPDFRYDDALPPRCSVDGAQPAVSPKTTPDEPATGTTGAGPGN